MTPIKAVYSVFVHCLKARWVYQQRVLRVSDPADVYGPLEEEKASLAYRRSLYIVKDIQANEILTPDNVRAIRPGYGLPPKHQNIVLGRQAKIFLRKGTALHWDMIQ